VNSFVQEERAHFPFNAAPALQDGLGGSAYRRSMRRLILLFALSAMAAAQPPPDLPLTAAETARIVEAVADRIDRMYVDPAKGKAIADTLRSSLKSGKFDDLHSALPLVRAVSAILRTSGDAHLRFGYSYEPSTKADDAPDTPEEHAKWLRDVARNGFGIGGVQRLDGNVGLLTWRKFHEPEAAGDAVASAMKLLQSTDALIIDLRTSEGGSPAFTSAGGAT
jgi:hypothetical protein